jgi:hypothetical protein
LLICKLLNRAYNSLQGKMERNLLVQLVGKRVHKVPLVVEP